MNEPSGPARSRPDPRPEAAPGRDQPAFEGPILALEAVSKGFGGAGARVEVLREVSLSVAAGSFLSILGPSGCGKSTLLRVLAGLEVPDAGRARLEGRALEGPSADLGYMPQRDLLLPWRRMIDNAGLALEIQGLRRAEARRRARALLPTFGLEGFEEAWPAALSGGMRQRVALLRTVLPGRRILLLDEPFGALDALTRLELQDWLLDMRRQFGWTVVMVTHDVAEAVYLSDQVLVMSARPARIVHRLNIDLPRPRSHAMQAAPAFGEAVTTLLEQLGVPVDRARRTR